MGNGCSTVLSRNDFQQMHSSLNDVSAKWVEMLDQESNNKNWIRNNSPRRTDRSSATEMVWVWCENGGWKILPDGLTCQNTGEDMKTTWEERLQKILKERGTEWNRVSATVQDHEKGKALCKPSTTTSPRDLSKWSQQSSSEKIVWTYWGYTGAHNRGL